MEPSFLCGVAVLAGVAIGGWAVEGPQQRADERRWRETLARIGETHDLASAPDGGGLGRYEGPVGAFEVAVGGGRVAFGGGDRGGNGRGEKGGFFARIEIQGSRAPVGIGPAEAGGAACLRAHGRASRRGRGSGF